ncbi:ABC transporter permease [Aminobacter sp. Piv2-1]|uniref:ABC transporter permease n=1 Tax=Aminobacter sp. Piv2-1 TaxID=3031122 RepID=UPI0030A7B782
MTNSRALDGLISFLVGLLLWDLLARFIIRNPLFIPTVDQVINRLVELWGTGELQIHLMTSGLEFVCGFLLAIIFGVLGGMLLTASRSFRALADPWVSMLYATPLIALGPLFIIWLGIGLISKIALIFLTAIFPILINTQIGLAETDKNYLDCAKSFRASPIQTYLKVRLPSSLPFIIAGIRLGAARGLVGVVGAELFGARAGLGFLILTSSQNFDIPAVFGGILIFAFTGFLVVEGIQWLENRLAPWRNKGKEL